MQLIINYYNYHLLIINNCYKLKKKSELYKYLIRRI
jgi:hypothetical protein